MGLPLLSLPWLRGKFAAVFAQAVAGKFAATRLRSHTTTAASLGPMHGKFAAVPLTNEEARQQAQAEGLTLRVADNSAGYFGVGLSHPGKPKPYQAQVTRGGKKVHLGSFATAEEAALSVARSPEGQAAAQRAAAVPPPLTGDDDGGDDAGEEGEEEIQVLDAVEVLVDNDDALAIDILSNNSKF